MDRYLLANLVALAFSSSSVAEMISYSGTTSAVFTNPIGGVSNGGGTTQLNLGDLNHGSIVYFSGVSPFSANAGSPFNLGGIGLWNGHATNIPTQATFQETLNLSQPNLGPLNFNFNVAFSKSGDSISAAFTPGQTSTVTVGHSAYTLELFGLSNSRNASASISTLTTPPCQDNTAYVWGQLTQVDPPPSVPEPSAFALAAIGLVMIALRRSRKPRMGRVPQPI